MSDFFGALELELRAAASRPPRRQIGVGTVIGGLAAAALVAAAVLLAATVAGGGGDGDSARLVGGGGVKPAPVGTVIPKGEGTPPRPKRSLVVATGTNRLAGPWQLEIQRSLRLVDDRGEVMQPAGLKCVQLYLLDPPHGPGHARGPAGAGYCGPFPRTPGFTRGQLSVPMERVTSSGERILPEQVLVFGRTPERAEYVRLIVPGSVHMRAPVHDGPRGTGEDYYLLAIPARIGPAAKINWLDEDNKPGSRGIALLPPAVTR